MSPNKKKNFIGLKAAFRSFFENFCACNILKVFSTFLQCKTTQEVLHSRIKVEVAEKTIHKVLVAEKNYLSNQKFPKVRALLYFSSLRALLVSITYF